MRRLQGRMMLISLFVVIGLAVLLTACGSKEEPTGPPTLNFFTSFDQADSAAAAENKPFMVKFYTDWCTWCKTMDTITLVDSSVVTFLNDSFVVAKVNAEVDTSDAQKYSVMGYPTTILFDSKGDEIERIVGYLPPDEFLETVDNYMHGIGTLDYYLAMADTAGTTDVYFAIADKYNDRGKTDDAKTYYEKVIKTDPDNKDGFTDRAMISLGNIMRGAKDYDGAVKEFGQVIKNFKETESAADAEIWTAITYRQKGDTTKAIQWFEGFLKNHPESSDTSYAMAQIEKLKNPPKPEEKE